MTYTITREVYEVLRQVARDVVQDGSTRDYYSGRGMYGRGCLALVALDTTGLVRWTFGVSTAISAESEEVAEQVSNLVDELSTAYPVRVDSLGYHQVFYWPDVTVEPRS